MKKIKYLLLAIMIVILMLLISSYSVFNLSQNTVLSVLFVIVLIMFLTVSTLTKAYKSVTEKRMSFSKLIVGSIAVLLILLIHILYDLNILPYNAMTIPVICFIFSFVIAIMSLKKES